MCGRHPTEIEIRNKKKRSDRLAQSKLKGDHTKYDWLEMKEFFENTCAMCLGERGYINVCKDHIVPLYFEGDSSNGIDNIQPLCAGCNQSKGGDCADYRPKLAKFLNKTLPDKYKIKEVLNG